MTTAAFFNYKLKEIVRKLEAAEEELATLPETSSVTAFVPTTEKVRDIQSGYRAMKHRRKLLTARQDCLQELYFIVLSCPTAYKAWCESPSRTHKRLRKIQSLVHEAEGEVP